MRKAPMPQTVKAGCHVYRVVLKPARQMPKTNGRPDLGYTKFDQGEIWLKDGMKRDKNQEILWHEVKHTCTYPDFIGVRKTDEEWIERTASAEVLVLQENPELVAYLTR